MLAPMDGAACDHAPRPSRWRSLLTQLRSPTSLAELPSLIFAAWAVLLVVRVHWPYVRLPSEQSIDEGYLIAIGQRMLHGRMLPFVDGTAHSGPLFLILGALLAAIDPFSWLPVRVAAMLGFACCSLLAFACGRRAGRPLAGAIAAAAMPLYASVRMEPFDGIAFNAELPSILGALAALYAALRALHDRERPVSMGWLFAAGMFTAFGALSKQIAVLLVLPVAYYVASTLSGREELSRRARLRCMLVYAAAAALPIVSLLARYAAAGALGDLYYYLVTYNRDSYMFPFRDRSIREHYRDWLAIRPYEVACSLLAVSWGLSQLVAARVREGSLVRAFHASGFDVAVALMAVGGVIGARASMREFEHYYLMAVPGFALLGGSLVEAATRSQGAPPSLARAPLRALHHALLLAPLVLVGEVAWSQRQIHHMVAWSTQHMRLTDLATAHEEPPVCDFIRKHSRPDEPLFVWGFRGQLYVACERLPASRFVFTTFVAGFVPGADLPPDVEDRLVVPGSRERLIAELEATKPPVIVDAARTMGSRGFRRIEPLARYVDEHYRSAGAVGGDEVWLRRETDQASRAH